MLSTTNVEIYYFLNWGVIVFSQFLLFNIECLHHEIQ